VAASLALLAFSLVVAIFVLAFSAEDGMLPRGAKRRAKRLFLSKLSTKQRISWLRHRRFEVTAVSGRRYTLLPYDTFNIRSGGDAFCIKVEGRIPIYDKLLAQRLLIESDERLFLTLANTRRR
jgi:hypothetical protein